MRRIACGYLCVDIYPQHDFVSIGGECANFAVATAHHGHSIELVARVGSDPIAASVVGALSEEGVTCSIPAVNGTNTSFCIVLVEGSERKFPYGEFKPFDRYPLTMEELHLGPEPVSVHLDFLSRHLIPALRKQESVVTSVDSGREQIKKDPLLADVTFVSLSSRESPHELLDEVGERVRDTILVMTQGPEGAWAFTQRTLLHHPAPPISVVDSTGAGDSFQAGFMHEYLRSGRLEAALAVGTQWAQEVCFHMGASIENAAIKPDLKEHMLRTARDRLGWE